MHGVRIGARDDVHAQLAAARVELAEAVAVAQEAAAVVQRDLRGVVRDSPAGAQTRRVTVRPLEEVQPEVDVVLDGIVLDQGQLRPAHRPVEPVIHRDRRTFILP